MLRVSRAALVSILSLGNTPAQIVLLVSSKMQRGDRRASLVLPAAILHYAGGQPQVTVKHAKRAAIAAQLAAPCALLALRVNLAPQLFQMTAHTTVLRALQVVSSLSMDQLSADNAKAVITSISPSKLAAIRATMSSCPTQQAARIHCATTGPKMRQVVIVACHIHSIARLVIGVRGARVQSHVVPGQNRARANLCIRLGVVAQSVTPARLSGRR